MYNWVYIIVLSNVFFVLSAGTIFPPTDPNVLIKNVVIQYGYPFEIHHVVTEDGYVLALHRIPFGYNNGIKQREEKESKNRSAVLMMHGLLGCSSDWILTGPNRSLAFLLADNGYDVWLGNARGTTNSKNHTLLSTHSSKFWDFSWHEIGYYDTPAIIDYVLDQTEQNGLFYVGFSQGTTQFWVLTSLRPEYNKKIKLMMALAPVAYTGHIIGLLRPLSFFANLFKDLYKYIGYFEVLSNSYLMKYVTYSSCRRYSISHPLCELLVYLIGGFSVGEFDHEHFPQILEYAPAGCSYKQLVHYAMGIQNPEHFRPYDYGIIKNRQIYGAYIPPEYPLEKITAPVALYNGLNDWLAHPKDVELLKTKLPNVIEKCTVTLKKLNHFDFLFGNSIRSLVYNRLIQLMNSFIER